MFRVPNLLKLMCVCFALRASAQSTSAPLVTVRADLMKAVHTDRLKEGDKFFLRTTERWQRPDCEVPINTTVSGTVASVARVKSGPARVAVALRFEPLACAGSAEHTLLPLLVAMEAGESHDDSALKRMSTAGLEDQTIAGLFSPNRPGVPTASDTVSTAYNAIPVVNTLGMSSEKHGLKTGEVAGLRGVKLELPSGDASTKLVSAHDFDLGARATSFVLAVVSAPALPAAKRAETRARVAKESEPDPGAEFDRQQALDMAETDVCAASGCQQVAASAADVGNAQSWSVPLAGFGYQARPEQRITALENNASVHFLGEDQILLTFTLHALVKRSQQQRLWAAKPRRVRAIVLSRQDGRVLLEKDWTVPTDTGSYVWTYGGDRVLAQVGNDLVALGPDLAVEQRFALPGPLAFVSAAPRGELVLVATLHEKHSPQEHEGLMSFLGPDQPIDENYDLTGLDANLHVIGARMLYAQPFRPAILRSAMISAEQGRAGHWELNETTWTGQKTVLAHVKSDCVVQVASLPGDLVLARGCVPNQSSSTWYRVLNEHGAVLLKGNYDHFDAFQQADTDGSGTLFALATSHFEQPFSFVPQIRAGDFKNLAVNVYTASSGKLIFSKHLETGSPEQQTFSLSPSGGTLAVLTSDAIRTYTLEAGK